MYGQSLFDYYEYKGVHAVTKRGKINKEKRHHRELVKRICGFCDSRFWIDDNPEQTSISTNCPDCGAPETSSRGSSSSGTKVIYHVMTWWEVLLWKLGLK